MKHFIQAMTQYTPYRMVCRLELNDTPHHRQALFEHMYDFEKTYRWFNVKPICWMRSAETKMDVGSTLHWYFGFPFFSYRFSCTKKLPGRAGFELKVAGPLAGDGKILLLKQAGKLILHHELNVSGKNRLIHWYYGFFTLGHDPFMKGRMRKLKRLIMSETA